MKIVFLDIDGVLATVRSILGADVTPPYLEPDTVALLVRLCEEGDEPVRVVISSSWRYLYGQAKVFERLEQFGLDRSFIHEDWQTVSFDDETRGDEIGEWLSRHPEVGNFVILDDDSDMEPYVKHLVQTTFELGFLESHWQAARSILHGDSAPERS